MLMLFCFGVGYVLELCLEIDGVLCQSYLDVSGCGDIVFGVKWCMQEGDEGWFGMGWLFEVQMFIGSGVFKGYGLWLVLDFLVQWQLLVGWLFGMMVGVFVECNVVDQCYIVVLVLVSFGILVNDKLYVFVEVVSQQLVFCCNGGNVIMLGIGLVWQVMDDVQLDMVVFCGLNYDMFDWVWMVGLLLCFQSLVFVNDDVVD